MTLNVSPEAAGVLRGGGSVIRVHRPNSSVHRPPQFTSSPVREVISLLHRFASPRAPLFTSPVRQYTTPFPRCPQFTSSPVHQFFSSPVHQFLCPPLLSSPERRLFPSPQAHPFTSSRPPINQFASFSSIFAYFLNCG